MYYWKPFRSRYNLYSSLLSEINFGVFTFMLFGFGKPMSDQKASIMGWIMIGMVILSLTGSWACVLLQQLSLWKRRKMLQEKKEAKKQKKVKTTNTKKKGTEDCVEKESETDEANQVVDMNIKKPEIKGKETKYKTERKSNKRKLTKQYRKCHISIDALSRVYWIGLFDYNSYQRFTFHINNERKHS
eukprot:TRINITY_DN3072_c0_g1_i1.p12 TRINITY_DN3072_c0_g1~~TRINITY_DN3072_c0_g1_i1.p12  ORF type:complete len:187 (+),score=20.20 TRINITY_DN3072_c0_g1_i1:5563-6123(+)